jgi:ketosteroid isomerase-like protein
VNPEETIVSFYDAFGRRDAEAMAACYAPDAHFSDPVFRDLHGPEVSAMWEMLTASGRDLHVHLLEHRAEGASHTGTAHWVADYTFSRTGRRVHNDVHATFRFSPEGLIAEHRDSFNIYAWAKQALGPVGSLLGWASPFQKSLRAGAASTLSKYMLAETLGSATAGASLTDV